MVGWSMGWSVSINVVDWSGVSWGGVGGGVVDWSMGINMSGYVVDWSGMSWGVVHWLSVGVTEVVSGDIISVLMAVVVWSICVMRGVMVVVWSVSIAVAWVRELVSVALMMAVVVSVEGVDSVVGMVVVVGVVVVVMVHWLHLQNKVAAGSVDIGWVENGGIGLESTGSLMPSSAVELVEVISPVEDEFAGCLVVVEDLNIVVKDVPWHVDWVEAIAP